MNNLHEFYDFEPGDEVYHYEYEIMCFGIIRKIEGNYAIVEDDFACFHSIHLARLHLV